MAFFGLFGSKRKGYASPWLQLTVVYATAKDGLEPEDAFALRGMVLAAAPIDFEFKNGNSYIVFFQGTAAGLQAANDFAGLLREYAREKSLAGFGVGVQQGECLAQMRANWRFAGKPAGTANSLAMRQAAAEAGADAA